MDDVTGFITGNVPTSTKLAKNSKLSALTEMLDRFPNLNSMGSIDDLILRNAAKAHLIEDFPEEAIKRGIDVPKMKPVIKEAVTNQTIKPGSFIDTEGVKNIDISPFKKKITTLETYTPQVVGESVPKVVPSMEKMGLMQAAKTAGKYLNPISDVYNLLDPTLTANPSDFKEEDVPGQPGRVSKGDIILPKLNNIVKPEDKDEPQ